MGKLTTHVLDTAHGVPAAGVRILLFRLHGDERTLLATRSTNQDGRCDEPLLDGPAFAPGTYELVFSIGTYFRDTPVVLTEPPFLDEVPLRFNITDNRHYHVPLLASPWSFSTYRGS